VTRPLQTASLHLIRDRAAKLFWPALKKAFRHCERPVGKLSMLNEIPYSTERSGEGNLIALPESVCEQPNAHGDNAECAEGNNGFHLFACLS
jgi:hypothetical protein